MRSSIPQESGPGECRREKPSRLQGVLPQGHRIRLGRLFGIPVEITPSWLLLSGLVLWSFWERYTVDFGHRGDGIGLLMAIVATVLLLLSVFLHELAHALMGRLRGLKLTSITLYLFGGATTASDPGNPADEFLFTVVGPLANLALALFFWGVTIAADHGGVAAMAQVTGEAAWLNLLLGAFNLFPAAPLDGGHLLEAVVWRITRDHPRATRVSAMAGAGLGGALIGIGVIELLMVKGGLFEGLWLGLIGYVLLEGAKAEKTRAWIEQVLQGKPAYTLLTEHAPPVTSDTSVGWLIGAEFQRHHVDAVPVEDHGHSVGIVLAQDALSVPADKRFDLTAGSVMRSLAALPHERVDASAIKVLQLLATNPLVVLEDPHGRVVGAVSQRQVGMVLDRMRYMGAQQSV
ncbi:MAG: site-2 protease family protein [Actinobacteria bacterium]|nr:site-2 protease family protein [Actinomycetota bacterium]